MSQESFVDLDNFVEDETDAEQGVYTDDEDDENDEEEDDDYVSFQCFCL